MYPFTPQPVITQAVMMAADTPVFVGIGGGLTKGERVLGLGRHAEYQGAFGVVVNAPTPNSTVKELKEALDIPVIVTVVSEEDDIAGRIEAGAEIFNVSAALKLRSLSKNPQKISRHTDNGNGRSHRRNHQGHNRRRRKRRNMDAADKRRGL